MSHWQEGEAGRGQRQQSLGAQETSQQQDSVGGHSPAQKGVLLGQAAQRERGQLRQSEREIHGERPG